MTVPPSGMGMEVTSLRGGLLALLIPEANMGGTPAEAHPAAGAPAGGPGDPTAAGPERGDARGDGPAGVPVGDGDADAGDRSWVCTVERFIAGAAQVAPERCTAVHAVPH